MKSIAPVASFAGSMAAILLISDLFGDQVPANWFAAWSVGLALLLEGTTSYIDRRLPNRQLLIRSAALLGVGVVTLAVWVIFVAGAGLIFGLNAHRVLNLSAITAWGVGTLALVVTRLAARSLIGRTTLDKSAGIVTH
jgi:hypothetical protein